ncbi:DUF3089 domain-containing protein [Sphingomonas nostoxanthinifaciens]|uniref:DUF3089 domain-containing protein n=1 Tax=Sphingomonas nostoxanthinifaciens TaxID=2872652 RepID=UPI001CC21CAD|nr:DUF3089 domain-containing protein [Sphingomonas nostoxanthinifaciens]UAK22942.1 DUF3089 domain-containing protein [Sphingomonas nostoxanthinifaciens]
MRRFIVGLVALASAFGPALAQVPEEPKAGDTAPVDYSQPASWMCRPGTTEPTCVAGLDAVTIAADGHKTVTPWQPAADPKIDCFYVYPTASLDQTLYSDLTPDGGEKRSVHAQFARFGSVCRTFAPLYHQLTMAHLRWRMANPGNGDLTASFALPYRDIRDAWRSYMAHDNHGRGVVLIGHSQGSILLKRLIAEEIDGKPAQKLLVGAYLAGNPDLDQASFKAIPACHATGQVGCIVAWSSYPATALDGARAFGKGRLGQAPLCVNPAAIGGGRGALKPLFSKSPSMPAGDPPFFEPLGALTAECVTDERGSVLAVRIEQGWFQSMMERIFGEFSRTPGWGIHPLDISLVEGNLLDLVSAQSAAWEKKGR